MKTKEWKIGEIFEYNSEWYQCVEQPKKYDKTVCAICAFQGNGNCDLDGCSEAYRSDKKSVIFKKLEKVGEQFLYKGKQMQSYIRATDELIWNNNLLLLEHVDSDIIDIEIKQKEDMEEKEQCGDNRFEVIEKAKNHLLSSTNIESRKEEMKVLDNFLFRCWQMGWLKQYEDAEESKSTLKPFDLEEAKAGKPVCTRDGRRVRIICFDCKDETFQIVALVSGSLGKEEIISYDKAGYSTTRDRDEMLMMLQKKEGWVNVYKNQIHDTPKSAEEGHKGITDYIKTIRVEWEE